MNESTRVDFDSELGETDVYEKLKLEDYKLYQFIENDFLYNMELDELDSEGIKYDKLTREKKTWFGLGRKSINDILIHPNRKFYYPYQYGHYFYLFTKNEVQDNQFTEWLNENFPKRFADFDELVGYGKSNELKLLNKDDYVLITNHDYQKEFGIAAESKTIDKLIERLNENFKTEIEAFKM
jgi:hypothetical protein